MHVTSILRSVHIIEIEDFQISMATKAYKIKMHGIWKTSLYYLNYYDQFDQAVTLILYMEENNVPGWAVC